MQYIDQYLSECNIILESAMLTQCWTNWYSEEHIPDFNRLYFILKGEGELVVDGKAYYPKPGELFLMPAGVRQAFRTINENCFYKYWCHFRAESREIRIFDVIKTPLSVMVQDPEALKIRFESMVKNFNSDSALSKLRAKSDMLEILSVFLEQVGEENITSSSNVPTENLNRIAAYIAGHINEEITLEKLAALLHFHPNYFISFFKHYFGVSPLKYVSGVRIEKAKLLLKTTGLSIAEVAEETGYHDLFHFSKRFKEQTGYSPSDFRKI